MTHRDRNSLYAGWVLHPITYRIVLHSEISKVSLCFFFVILLPRLFLMLWLGKYGHEVWEEERRCDDKELCCGILILLSCFRII